MTAGTAGIAVASRTTPSRSWLPARRRQGEAGGGCDRKQVAGHPGSLHWKGRPRCKEPQGYGPSRSCVNSARHALRAAQGRAAA